MVKFIPCEKLSKKESDTTAAGGGFREWSEWQWSARCKSASPDAASAGHRNRKKRKLDLAKRQTWGEWNPVTRKPKNSRACSRRKAQSRKEDSGSVPYLFYLIIPSRPAAIRGTPSGRSRLQ